MELHSVTEEPPEGVNLIAVIRKPNDFRFSSESHNAMLDERNRRNPIWILQRRWTNWMLDGGWISSWEHPGADIEKETIADWFRREHVYGWVAIDIMAIEQYARTLRGEQ